MESRMKILQKSRLDFTKPMYLCIFGSGNYDQYLLTYLFTCTRCNNIFGYYYYYNP